MAAAHEEPEKERDFVFVRAFKPYIMNSGYVADIQPEIVAVGEGVDHDGRPHLVLTYKDTRPLLLPVDARPLILVAAGQPRLDAKPRHRRRGK